MTLEQSRALVDRCMMVNLAPGQELFRAGDPSESGAFIVAQGKLGVFLPSSRSHSQHHPPKDPNGRSTSGGSIQHTPISTLLVGESVGDIDVMDGAPRTVTCRALDAPCRLVQVPRDLFLRFVVEHPRTLHAYLNMVSELGDEKLVAGK